MGTGDDFGLIIVRDIGATPCLLSGSAQITALDAQDRPIVGARGLGSAAITPDIGMTANTALWGEYQSPPSGINAAELFFGGENRDDPTTGQLCTPDQEVYPAYWRVALAGGVWDIANDDPGAVVGLGVPKVSGCVGDFLAVTIEPTSALSANG
jgi:hypothetical protein